MDPKLSFRTVCISKAKKHPLEEGSLLFISCWPVKGSRFLISSQTAKKFYLDHIWLLTSFLFFFVTGMFWTIASGPSGLANLEIGHQVPHLIRIYTKKESLKFFFRFIRNVSRPLNSLVHACLIWFFAQGKSLFSDGLFLKMLEFWY